MSHEHELPEKDLKFSIILTGAYMIVELVGGYFSGSLALISDGFHMLRDLFSLILSYFTLRLSKNFPTMTRTFGYHRTEILAAFINSLLLFFIGAGILYYGFMRVGEPREIQSIPMLSIALLGLIVNLFVMFRLKGHEDLNVKSAYLHVFWDTASSVAVIVGAGLIYLTGITIVDTLLSIIIASLTILQSLGLLVETINILLLEAPKGVSVDEVIDEMKKVPGVLDVHGVHLWTLCSNIHVLDCHIHSCKTKLSEACKIVNQLNKRLEKFNIKHTTFQFECDRCPIGKLKHIKH